MGVLGVLGRVEREISEAEEERRGVEGGREISEAEAERRGVVGGIEEVVRRGVVGALEGDVSERGVTAVREKLRERERGTREDEEEGEGEEAEAREVEDDKGELMEVEREILGCVSGVRLRGRDCDRFFCGVVREGEEEEGKRERDAGGFAERIGLLDLEGSFRGGILGMGFLGWDGVGDAGSSCGGMEEERGRGIGGEGSVGVGEMEGGGGGEEGVFWGGRGFCAEDREDDFRR